MSVDKFKHAISSLYTSACYKIKILYQIHPNQIKTKLLSKKCVYHDKNDHVPPPSSASLSPEFHPPEPPSPPVPPEPSPERAERRE